jgi:hypothetical protein
MSNAHVIHELHICGPDCGLETDEYPEDEGPEYAPTRSERREARIENERKMRMSGRPTFLLGASTAAQQRRRLRRRTGKRA